MPATSVEIEQTLAEKIGRRAAARGISVRAHLEAILERELAKPADDEQDEAITRKFAQLGYIDAGLDI